MKTILGKGVSDMVLNATFNNLSATSWRYSEKTTDMPQVTDKKTLSHNVVSSTPRLNGIRTHNVCGDRH